MRVTRGSRERRADVMRFEVTRHRHRHPGRGAGATVPGLHAGRRLDHAALWRHRPGPGHLAAAGRADGRRRSASRARRTRAPPSGSRSDFEQQAGRRTPVAPSPALAGCDGCSSSTTTRPIAKILQHQLRRLVACAATTRRTRRGAPRCCARARGAGQPYDVVILDHAHARSGTGSALARDPRDEARRCRRSCCVFPRSARRMRRAARRRRCSVPDQAGEAVQLLSTAWRQPSGRVADDRGPRSRRLHAPRSAAASTPASQQALASSSPRTIS